MENAVGMLLNAVWFFVYLVAFLYNKHFRPDFRPAAAGALVLAIGYATTQYLSYLVFDGLRYSEQMQVQYLLWSACCASMAVMLIFYHSKKRYRIYWPIRIVLALLIVDAIANLTMHVDQVIVGLDDFGQPNSNWRQDYWWLWTAYSTVSNLNSFMYALVLVVPISTTGDFVHNLFRQITSDLRKLLGFNVRSDSVYNRLNVVLDMVNGLPNGAEKLAAKEALAAVVELIARQDEQGVSYETSAHMLISMAAEIALRTDSGITLNATSRQPHINI